MSATDNLGSTARDQIEWVRVGDVSDLPQEDSVQIDLDGLTIALFHHHGRFHAVDGLCLHHGGPLSEGELKDSTVTCPWHKWRYHLDSGERLDRSGSRLRVYPVRIVDDSIILGIPAL